MHYKGRLSGHSEPSYGGVAESVIPDPVRIQMLTKVLYNKTYIQIQFKFKFNSVLKRALENMNFNCFPYFRPFLASLDLDPDPNSFHTIYIAG